MAERTFLSTSPLRGTTHNGDKVTYNGKKISIHVPLAGDDLDKFTFWLVSSQISIHVPLAGDDPIFLCSRSRQTDFYPRPPCGGRPAALVLHKLDKNFYPRPPCGGRPGQGWATRADINISIHVPLAGDDFALACASKVASAFLSTSPLRGTIRGCKSRLGLGRNFYPRPPCGGRPDAGLSALSGKSFLSTSPLRGTTPAVTPSVTPHKFLSTSPLRGTTWQRRNRQLWQRRFLSTSPLRGTT